MRKAITEEYVKEDAMLLYPIWKLMMFMWE